MLSVWFTESNKYSEYIISFKPDQIVVPIDEFDRFEALTKHTTFMEHVKQGAMFKPISTFNDVRKWFAEIYNELYPTEILTFDHFTIDFLEPRNGKLHGYDKTLDQFLSESNAKSSEA